MIHITDDETTEGLSDKEIMVYPIRISQILYSVWRLQKKHPIKRRIDTLPLSNVWVAWANESVDNYELLWNYGMDILDEYQAKFGDVALHPYKHSSSNIMEELGSLPPLPAVGLTDKPKATVWQF
jgi:hypothetical protein